MSYFSRFKFPWCVSLLLFSFTFFITPAFAQKAAATGTGFQCVEKCPANPVGQKYISLDCRCKKSTSAGTCTASGDCQLYTNAGVAIVPKSVKACTCDKDPTVFTPSDEAALGRGQSNVATVPCSGDSDNVVSSVSTTRN